MDSGGAVGGDVDLSRGRDGRLTEIDKVLLIRSYHFLFNEKLSSLFDQCHEALWRHFKQSGDLSNLLILFRHSSLLWRLRGREDFEKKYVRDLAKVVGDKISQDIRSSNREVAYYVVRVSSVLAAPDTK